MTKGIPISKEMRRQVHHSLIVLRQNPQQTKENNICLENISLQHLELLKVKLENEDFAEHFLAGPHLKSGRPQKYSPEAKQIMREIACERKFFYLKQLKTEFENFYFHNLQHNPNRAASVSTIHRYLRKSGITHKTIERRHMLCDDVAGLQFMEQLAMFDPLLLVDVDEMKQTPEDFLRKFGWAPVGDQCIKEQIVIGTRSFSIIAAVSPFGFVCHEIHEANITGLEFSAFLENRLAPTLALDNVVILDNARIHHTDEVRALLEEITHGNYVLYSVQSTIFPSFETNREMFCTN